MRPWTPVAIGFGALLTIAALFGPDWDLPPKETVQTGYRGTGMAQIQDMEKLEAYLADNQVPEPLYEVEPAGIRASEVYENVPVLGHLDLEEFNLLMASITAWVSPEQGCAYCHGENFADDSLYTKVVSRNMLLMTQHMNENWTDHVAATGVTCYTCHRGEPVPQYVWYEDRGLPQPRGLVGYRAGQNLATASVGMTSLPYDPFTPLLVGEEEIQVEPRAALPAGIGPGPSIKQTERTYALMIHMSEALGVNCTFCHNTRSLASWPQSNPTRFRAYSAIRMLRDVNQNFLLPLEPVYPAFRLGPHADAPKANCLTCHRGVSKPLGGISMVADYPYLAELPPDIEALAPTQPAPEDQDR
jgi:photosynthetic reaction center cytochrome c subunit